MKRSRTAVMLVLAIALAGCGSGEGESSPKQSAAPIVPGVETIGGIKVDGRSISWDEVGDAEAYRVAVLDGDGRALWAGSAKQPSLEVPAHVMLPDAPRVAVSALDGDGRALAASRS